MTCVKCGGSPILPEGFYCTFCWQLRRLEGIEKLWLEAIARLRVKEAERKRLRWNAIDRLWNFGAGMKPGQEQEFWNAVERNAPELLPQFARQKAQDGPSDKKAGRDVPGGSEGW